MENKGILTKVLAVVGTILVWFPILTPILLTTILLIREHIFRFDYLMPAELGLFAFGGGIILLVAAILARSQVKFIGWGLGIGLALVVVGQVIAKVTGLADGLTEPTGWQWALVLGALAGYSLAIVAIGIGGILLMRDVFKPHQTPMVVH